MIRLTWIWKNSSVVFMYVITYHHHRDCGSSVTFTEKRSSSQGFTWVFITRYSEAACETPISDMDVSAMYAMTVAYLVRPYSLSMWQWISHVTYASAPLASASRIIAATSPQPGRMAIRSMRARSFPSKST